MKSSIVNACKKWRRENPKYQGGLVLTWKGKVYGWKDKLRDPQQERPGVVAVDEDDTIFIATGGDDYSGAKTWVEHQKK